MEKMIDNTGETLHEAGGVPELPEAINARMNCEDCGGCGKIGEEIPQGEFQPPEYEDCSSCNGSGIWEIEAFSASQLRAYGEQCALAALAARPLSGGWEPISTAPRDGTRVMLCVQGLSTRSHEQVCHLASWDGMHCYPFVPNAWTHWMPLPAPPAGTDEGGR